MKKYYFAIFALLIVGMLTAYLFHSFDSLRMTTAAPSALAPTRPEMAPSYLSLNAAVKAARHNIQYVDGNRLKGYPRGGYIAQNKANDVAAIFTAG